MILKKKLKEKEREKEIRAPTGRALGEGRDKRIGEHVAMEKMPNVSLCRAMTSTRTDQHSHKRLLLWQLVSKLLCQ